MGFIESSSNQNFGISVEIDGSMTVFLLMLEAAQSHSMANTEIFVVFHIISKQIQN